MRACADAHSALHVQLSGDLLWQLGDKAPPNDGFTAARIFPTQAAIAAAEAAAAAGDAAAGGEGGAGSSGAAEAAGEAAEQLGGLQLGAASSSVEGEGGGAAAAAGAAGAPGGALDMDALLEAAVLAGLHALKNADLPIQAGDFYTKFMVPAKPEGEQLNARERSGGRDAGVCISACRGMPCWSLQLCWPIVHAWRHPLRWDTHFLFVVFLLFLVPPRRRAAGHQGQPVEEAEQAAGQV